MDSLSREEYLNSFREIIRKNNLCRKTCVDNYSGVFLDKIQLDKCFKACEIQNDISFRSEISRLIADVKK